MSFEITKVYKQDVPALRFIGKKYGDNDRVNGMFGKHWGDWHQNGWFDAIVKQAGESQKALFDDMDAQIGLMRDKDGVFEYWIGIFMPEKTPVPDGYKYIDFPKGTLGVCWVYGKEEEVFCHEGECGQKLEEAGFNLAKDKEGTIWCMERYGCQRFTTPDENGKIILDICFYVK
jgi:predicted transcriptional regulator YdeE